MTLYRGLIQMHVAFVAIFSIPLIRPGAVRIP